MYKDEPKINILLVDDEPANLLALEAVLENLGLNLVKARSGEDALRELIHKDFAVILLDVLMPGMNGFETADLIRQRTRTQHTPIIFLTAMEKAEKEMFRGYALGAIDYMMKPFVPTVLRSKVSVLVELHRKTEEVVRMNEELNRKANELVILNLKLEIENEKRKRADEDLRLSEDKVKKLNELMDERSVHSASTLEERNRQFNPVPGKIK
jgi:DNA-binding response OmpR family regulator